MKKTLILIGLIWFNFSFSQIIITEVNYDTPHNEFYYFGRTEVTHHLGEFIELYNYTTEDIALDGWSLSDRVSAFYFPNGTIIKSGEMLLIAYKDPVYSNTNYVPAFFPNTLGKESKIIYQKEMMLRNDKEIVRLNMGMLRDIDFNGYTISSVGWDGAWPASNYDNTSPVNYYTDSWQLTENGTYTKAAATPLEAGYLPPLKPLEDAEAFVNAFYANVADMTWEYFALMVLGNTCTLVIPEISQMPSGTYLEQRKCFSYDGSGNNITAIDCSSEDEDPEPSDGYTQQQLDEIASKIIVYPNPTTNSSINITWDESINGMISTITATTTSGVSVGSISVISTDNSASFTLITQSSTIYIVTFYLDSGQMISKSIIRL